MIRLERCEGPAAYRVAGETAAMVLHFARPTARLRRRRFGVSARTHSALARAGARTVLRAWSRAIPADVGDG